MTVGPSGYIRKTNDLYETPPWCTQELLEAFPQIGAFCPIWDPAAGNHAITDVAKSRGHSVFTSDIATYQRVHDLEQDFFAFDSPFSGDIVTNFPYGSQNRLAVKCIRHALWICPGWVAALCGYTIDAGKTRRDLFDENSRFHARIVLSDRIQWFDGEHKNSSDHAWFVWRPSGETPKPSINHYSPVETGANP